MRITFTNEAACMPEPRIPFRDVQRVVETLHGQRGIDMMLCVVTRDGEDPSLRALTVSQREGLEGEGWRCQPVATTRVERSMSARQDESKTVVSMRVGGGSNEVDLSKPFSDAAFWTESAVEKFFFPYYQRVLDWSAFRSLQEAYYRPASGTPILAFTHLPTSDYDDHIKMRSMRIEPGSPRRVVLRELAGIGAVTPAGVRPISDLVSVEPAR